MSKQWQNDEIGTQRIGNYDDATVACLNQLAVCLKGDTLNLAWRLCDLTAQFTALYTASCYAQGDLDQRRMMTDYTHSINYVMNELMENAVKFRTTGDIDIKIGILDTTFCCAVANISSRYNAGKLHAFLQEITTGNAQDMLLQRFEANAMDPDNNASGLGFLTMVNDYGVNFGCQFEVDSAQPDQVRIDTLITLPMLKV